MTDGKLDDLIGANMTKAQRKVLRRIADPNNLDRVVMYREAEGLHDDKLIKHVGPWANANYVITGAGLRALSQGEQS